MGGRGSGSGMKGYIDWLSKEGSGRGSVTPIDIDKYQGQSLEQIEGRLRNLKHEELFAIDRDGKIVAAFRGTVNSVSFDANLLDVDGLTVTHGHPKSVAEFGGTFSFADMANMLKSNWAEHRATASGQGEMNYIIRRTTNSDSKGYYRQLNRDIPKLKSTLQQRYNDSYKDAISKGMSREAAMHKARQIATGVLNAYYKRTSSKFGFEYVTRKEEYTYNR